MIFIIYMYISILCCQIDNNDNQLLFKVGVKILYFERFCNLTIYFFAIPIIFLHYLVSIPSTRLCNTYVTSLVLRKMFK